MEIRKAERHKAKLRLGIASISGGGKTYSSLLMAFGLGGKIGVIDTENGSADLYAHLGAYDIIRLSQPYTVAKYREAIKTFESAGYTSIIIDSLSHCWSGEGGLLDKQGKIADSTHNSYTAWRAVTPDHNALVEAILQSPCHIIATMRSKQEYAIETENGKNIVKKLGMAPVQREGMEYEFTVFMDLDQGHNAKTTKDRTGLFDGQLFKITKETGLTLAKWLESGKEVPAEQPKEAQAQPQAQQTAPQQPPAAGLPPTPAPPLATEAKKSTGIIETVKSAQTPKGMRYGIKLKGKDGLYGTASAPAAQRAEKMIGQNVEVTYKEEGKKFALVGFDLAK